MKTKIYSNLIFSIIIFLLLISNVVVAVTPGGMETELDRQRISKIENIGGWVEILGNILKWVYTIFFSVAALFIIMAAFYYLTAQGNPEKVTSAHNMMIYAIVAIVVAIIAVSIPILLRTILQSGGTQ